MEDKAKVLCFAGSTRKDSYNKRLARIAAKLLEEKGSEVNFIDLSEYPLPLYDADLEEREGIPPNAIKLKEMFIEADGFLISSPEYNSSVSAVLKNTIDWISRPQKDEKSLIAFQGKVAALVSASPGQLGGIRGLVHLRSILGNMGVILLPEQLCINKAFEAFTPEDTLVDMSKQENLSNIVEKLASLCESLREKSHA